MSWNAHINLWMSSGTLPISWNYHIINKTGRGGIQVFWGLKLIKFRGAILRKEIEKKTSRKSGVKVNTLGEKKSQQTKYF